MGGTRTSEAAVSSVIGTVLMLGITVSVFAGISIVVLGEFEDADERPRSDLGVVRGGGAYLLQHRGGDAIPLEGATLLVGVGAVQREVPMTEFATQTGDGRNWRLGDTLCVSCLFPDQEITGVQFVTTDALLVAEGTVPGLQLVAGTDLVVDDPVADPDDLRAGQSTVLRARVTNIGRAATGASVSLDVTVDGVSIGTATGTPLDGGTALRLEVPWTSTTGTHEITFTADPGGTIAEEDETNNVTSMTLEVVASVPDPGFAYQDVNLDGRFGEVDGDLAIDRADLEGGSFNAGGNGLVIPPSWGPLSAPSVSLAGARVETHGALTGQSGVSVTSTGDVVLAGDVTTLTDGGAVSVTAGGTVSAYDLRFQSRGAVSVQGTDVDLTDASPHLLVSGHALTLTATGDLLLDDAEVQVRGALTATAGATLSAHAADLDLLATGSALVLTGTTIDLSDGTIHAFGPATIDAAGDMDLSGLVLRLQTSDDALFIDADGTLTATGADLRLSGAATMRGGTLSAADLRLVGSGADNQNLLVQTFTGAADVARAILQTNGNLNVIGEAGVDANNATLTTSGTTNQDVKVKAVSSGNVDVRDATLVADRSITLTVPSASESVFVRGATFQDNNNIADVDPNGATIVGTPASGGAT